MDEGEKDKVLQPPASNANAANVPNSAPAPQPKAPDVTLEPALEGRVMASGLGGCRLENLSRKGQQPGAGI